MAAGYLIQLAKGFVIIRGGRERERERERERRSVWMAHHHAEEVDRI